MEWLWALGTAVVLPVVTAFVAGLFKYLAKDGPITPSDALLAADLLVAALALQVTYLGTGLVGLAAGDPFGGRVAFARLAFLLLIFVISLCFTAWIKHSVSVNEGVTWSLAVGSGTWAGLVLAATFAFNITVYSAGVHLFGGGA
ncbi:MAG: hypothetical protein ACLGIA_12160 [Actinomycetes bacterium]